MNLFCDVDWICINLHEVEVLWNLKFHAFSQILMIFAKSWIFAFFHMGEVKNWPPKNQPQDVGLEHFYNQVFRNDAEKLINALRIEFSWILMNFITENNWKLVLITEKRNRRFAQFCKYSRLQNFILSKKNTSSASGAVILGSILVCLFVLLLFERVLWVGILINPSFGKRGLRCATGCEKASFFAESCNSWGDTINRNSSCGRRFLQNLANRRFRKAMIKTSFQLFLLIKWWKTLR